MRRTGSGGSARRPPRCRKTPPRRLRRPGGPPGPTSPARPGSAAAIGRRGRATAPQAGRAPVRARAHARRGESPRRCQDLRDRWSRPGSSGSPARATGRAARMVREPGGEVAPRRPPASPAAPAWTPWRGESPERCHNRRDSSSRRASSGSPARATGRAAPMVRGPGERWPSIRPPARAGRSGAGADARLLAASRRTRWCPPGAGSECRCVADISDARKPASERPTASEAVIGAVLTGPVPRNGRRDRWRARPRGAPRELPPGKPARRAAVPGPRGGRQGSVRPGDGRAGRRRSSRHDAGSRETRGAPGARPRTAIIAVAGAPRRGSRRDDTAARGSVQRSKRRRNRGSTASSARPPVAAAHSTTPVVAIISFPLRHCALVSVFDSRLTTSLTHMRRSWCSRFISAS